MTGKRPRKWSVTAWPTASGWRLTWERGGDDELEEDKAIAYLKSGIALIEEQRAKESREGQ